MRARLSILAGVLAAACAPTLSGGPCSLEQQDCPANQTCAPLADGGGACVVSTGTGATTSGTTGASSSGTPSSTSSGATSTGTSGGPPVFSGIVQLNGGAVPVRDAWVYGFQGIPYLTDAGGLGGYAFVATADAAGAFSFSGPATDGSYGFVAQYDLDGDGLMSQLGGDADGTAVITSAGAPGALGLALDVETATCFSVTVQFAYDGGAETYLAGVGAEIPDISNDVPFTHAREMSTAEANYDAGGAPFPAGATPPGALKLTPSNAPAGAGNPIANAWIFTAISDGGQPLSDTGAFTFTLSDQGVRTPSQYPYGTCVVGYAPPPGLPTNVSSGADGSGGKILRWIDPGGTRSAAFLGDVVTVFEAGTIVYTTPAGSFDTSPLDLTVSRLQGHCLTVAIPCTAEIVGYFQVSDPNARSEAIEGGGVFQPL